MPDRTKLRAWFHRNEFFTITGFNGWSFIYGAKAKSEIIFWYAVILCLMILTIFNVQQLVAHFASSPVRYSMLLRSSTNDIELPNMTIVVGFPFLDYSKVLPSVISHEQCSPGASGPGHMLLHDYFCAAVRILYTNPLELGTRSTDYFETMVLSEQLKKIQKSPIGKLMNINKTAQAISLSDEKTLGVWLTEMDDAISSMQEYWMTVIESQTSSCHVTTDTYSLINQPLSRRPADTIMKVYALESLKDGTDPRSKLLDPANPMSIRAVLNTMEVTPKQLLVDLQSDLSKVIHMSVEPEGSVWMRDWELTSTRWVAGEFWPSEPAQHLTLALEVSPGMHKVQVKVSTYVNIWLRKVLSAWYQMSEKYFTKKSCSKFTFTTDEISGLIQEMLTEWSLYYEGKGNIAVELPTGEVVGISMGHVLDVVISPTFLFQSELDTCIDGTMASCMDECMRNMHLTNCKCIPWTYVRLTESEAICAEPCPKAGEKQCIEECAKQNLCSMVLTRNTISSHTGKDILQLEDHLETSIVSIEIPESVNYVQVTAEHEMVASTFFSLMGGAMEFWGAISITALFHLIIYILTLHCEKPKEQEEGEIDSSLEELETKLQKLEKTICKHNYSIWGRLWLWLNGNQFYDCTPLVGCAYISAAKSKAEMIFWYLVIIIFAIVAAIHLYTVAQEFSSRFTHFEAKPSMLTDIGVPNVTFDLILPYAELSSNIFQIEPIYDMKIPQSETSLHGKYDQIVTERINLGILDSIRGFADIFSKQLSEHLEKQIDRPWKLDQPVNKHVGMNVVSNKQIQDEWQALFSQTFSSLNQLRQDTKKSPLEQQQEIPELFVQPLKYGQRDKLFGKLDLLHQIKHGKDTKAVLEEHGTTSEELLASTATSLSKIINIEISNGANAFLKDFSLTSMPAIKLQFQVLSAHKLNDLEIKVNTLFRKWSLDLQDYIYNNYKNYDKKNRRFDLLAQLNGLRFTDIYNWYALFDGEIDIDALEMISPISIGQPPVELEIPIEPKWQLISNTAGECNENETYASCIQSCSIREYETMCNCVPWDFSYYDQNENKLCTESCELDSKVCEAQCRGVCWRQANIFRSEQLSHEAHENLMQYRLFVRQAMHVKMIESYTFTTGKFMAELGGVFEMWLGINIFTILHALVYLSRWFYSQRTKQRRRKIEPIEFFHEQLMALHALSEDISKTIHKLRITAKENSTKSQTKEQRFKWLWQNDFYSQTPMTGFLYISVAKSKWVASVWYLIIIIFCIFTVTNVRNAIVYYHRKPMSVNIEFLENAIDDGFPYNNLTLTFSMPFLELAQTNPMPLGYAKLKHKQTVLETLANSLVFVGNSYEFLLNVQYEALWNKWLELYDWSQVPTSEKLLSNDLSSENNFNHWIEIFETGAAKIEEFLESNGEKTMPKDPVAAQSIETEFVELLDAPMRRFEAAHVCFWLLDAIKSGDMDPEEKMLRLLRSNRTSRTTGIKNLVNEKNVLELFRQMQHDLAFMFHVRVVGAPNTRVVVKDINYLLSSKLIIEDIFRTLGRNDLASLQLKLHVHIPRETKTNKIELEVRSYAQMWHKYILDAFYNHYAKHYYTKAQMGRIEEIVRISKEQYSQRWYDYVLGSRYLTMLTGRGVEEAADKWFPNVWEMHSTTYFASRDKSCFDGSFDTCLEMCRVELFMSTCSCIPWTLFYAAQNPICLEPCLLDQNAVANCVGECEDKLSHPCQTALYETKRNYSAEGTEDLDRALYTVSLIKEENSIHKLQYTEVYDLTFSSFMSQLGGLLDLWLGFNLLAFIHLLAFIFKTILSKFNQSGHPDQDDLDLNQISMAEAAMKKRLLNLTDQVQQSIENQAKMKKFVS